MTFDEAHKMECDALFSARHDLEIWDGKDWTPLFNQRLIDDAFSDKGRAYQLGSPSGIKLSNGMAIRFHLRAEAKRGAEGKR